MEPQLPRPLLESAFVATNGEPAWPRDDALKVIEWATRSGAIVLGVEVWLPSMPGPTIPTPHIYAFELRPQPGEDRCEFLKRANRDSAEYVRNFEWDSADESHHGRVPYFNLTLEGPGPLPLAPSTGAAGQGAAP